ncbi:MAG: heavy-metal-associated domain-containing protein [Thermomicrobiales bacterium]|nr:heavy-metal-associated domain-containing protein [Thermomicrobiales bacterium]
MNDRLQHLTLIAPDISCAHCVATIDRTLNGIAGVGSVAVNEGTRQIDLNYDPVQVSPGEIAAALEDAGYPVER